MTYIPESAQYVAGADCGEPTYYRIAVDENGLIIAQWYCVEDQVWIRSAMAIDFIKGLKSAIQFQEQEKKPTVWKNPTFQTPPFNVILLLAFSNTCDQIQYTTARYIHQNFVQSPGENYHDVWYVEVSGGHKIDKGRVIAWTEFERLPGRQADEKN